jgi:hypothetical protein
MGGLLQLPPATWSSGRSDPVRAPGGQDESEIVTRVLGTYKLRLEAPPGFEPGMEVLQIS